MQQPLDYAASPSIRHRGLVMAIHLSAAAFPVLNLAGFYGLWLLAWVLLGHRPVYVRGGPDVPKLVLGNADHLATLLVAALPLGIILALSSVVILYITHRAPARVMCWAMTLIGLWAAFLALVSWDPHGVLMWLGS